MQLNIRDLAERLAHYVDPVDSKPLTRAAIGNFFDYAYGAGKNTDAVWNVQCEQMLRLATSKSVVLTDDGVASVHLGWQSFGH